MVYDFCLKKMKFKQNKSSKKLKQKNLYNDKSYKIGRKNKKITISFNNSKYTSARIMHKIDHKNREQELYPWYPPLKI